MMEKISSVKDPELARISHIVEKLFENESLYQERLDKAEMIQLVMTMFEEEMTEDKRRTIEKIDDDELTNLIDFAIGLEAVSGTLNDLTPEQLEMFDKAVEGR